MKRKLEYRWMLWCGIWAVVTIWLSPPQADARMRCWSLWAILCGSVLRDVRCLMYWIRIFPAFRSPSVRSGFRKPTRNVSIRC